MLFYHSASPDGGIIMSCLCSSAHALRCYTCMGSNNDDCNRQGSKSCPNYSDACASVVGHDSEYLYPFKKNYKEN